MIGCIRGILIDIVLVEIGVVFVEEMLKYVKGCGWIVVNWLGIGNW